MTTLCKQNLKWDLGSRISLFGEEVWSIILTITYCLRTIDLLVFQLFLKLTYLKTIEKTISLLFLNNTLFFKYSSKAKKDPGTWVPFCTCLHPVVILNSYLTEKIPEVHVNSQVY